MFFAHLPAGYLISRWLKPATQKKLIAGTLAAGMIGAVFQISICYISISSMPRHNTIILTGHICRLPGWLVAPLCGWRHDIDLRRFDKHSPLFYWVG